MPKTSLQVTAQRGLGPLSQVLSGYEGNLPYDPLPQMFNMHAAPSSPLPTRCFFILMKQSLGRKEQPSNPNGVAMSLVGMQRSTGRSTRSSFMVGGGRNEDQKERGEEREEEPELGSIANSLELVGRSV